MPPLPPEAQPFLAAIAESPDDPHPRLVFADWLEEQGRPGAAAASRWMAAGNRPGIREGSQAGWFASNPDLLELLAGLRRPSFEMLPDVPGLTLPGRPRALGFTQVVILEEWTFGSREEAERALLEAWPDDHPEVPS